MPKAAMRPSPPSCLRKKAIAWPRVSGGLVVGIRSSAIRSSGPLPTAHRNFVPPASMPPKSCRIRCSIGAPSRRQRFLDPPVGNQPHQSDDDVEGPGGDGAEKGNPDGDVAERLRPSFAHRPPRGRRLLTPAFPSGGRVSHRLEGERLGGPDLIGVATAREDSAGNGRHADGPRQPRGNGGAVTEGHAPRRPSHFFVQAASIRTSLFFLRFSLMIHRTSSSRRAAHFSIRGLPTSGRAATATLQQYPRPLRRVRKPSLRGSVDRSTEAG